MARLIKDNKNITRKIVSNDVISILRTLTNKSTIRETSLISELLGEASDKHYLADALNFYISKRTNLSHRILASDLEDTKSVKDIIDKIWDILDGWE